MTFKQRYAKAVKEARDMYPTLEEIYANPEKYKDQVYQLIRIIKERAREEFAIVHRKNREMMENIDIVDKIQRSAEHIQNVDGNDKFTPAVLLEAKHEIKRLRQIINDQSDSHTNHVKGLIEDHENRIKAYGEKIDELKSEIRTLRNTIIALPDNQLED